MVLAIILKVELFFPHQTSDPYSLMKAWNRLLFHKICVNHIMIPGGFAVTAGPCGILAQSVNYCEHLHYIFLYKSGNHLIDDFESELCIYETDPTKTF